MSGSSMLDALRPFLNAFLIGIGGLLVAFVLSKLIGRIWSRFFGNLVGMAIMVLTAKLILDNVGAVAALAAIVAAVTAAFGLGAKDIANDFMAGFSIFISRTYRVGDYLVIAGHEGWVSDMSPFVTTLETANDDEIYIRNAEAISGTIINLSARPGQLVSVKVPLPFSQDLKVAVDAIESAVKNFAPAPQVKKSKWSKNPPKPTYQPTVIVETTSGAYYIIEVRAFITERLILGPEKTRLFLLATDAIKSAGLSLAP